MRIGIVFGGASEEHGVSVKSAREIAKNLDAEKYEAVWIGIAPSGDWTLCAGPDHDWQSGAGRPVLLSPDGLVVLDQGRYEVLGLDVIFPVLHGTHGEDGIVQGLLELSGIPYIGCDVQSSALCMDKSLTYLVASAAGIATPSFRVLHDGDALDPDELSYPVFVKPARSGSSFGVTKVSSAQELPAAVADARQYDSKIVIEAAVDGHEIGCAILGDAPDLVLGEVDRVSLSHGFFRIHQESAPETGSENATFVVPADIPAESQAAVKTAATAVYRALGCTGLARVDMFLLADGSVMLNEVNTLPGMTSYSRYPRMMAAAGLSLADVIDQLVSVTLTGKRR